MKDSTRRTLRSAFQYLVGVAAALPLLVDAAGISAAAPGIAVGLAVAAGVTRMMALPSVDTFLPRWLRKGAV